MSNLYFRLKAECGSHSRLRIHRQAREMKRTLDLSLNPGSKRSLKSWAQEVHSFRERGEDERPRCRVRRRKPSPGSPNPPPGSVRSSKSNGHNLAQTFRALMPAKRSPTKRGMRPCKTCSSVVCLVGNYRCEGTPIESSDIPVMLPLPI